MWAGGQFDPNGLYDADYAVDLLNRYTQRDVPGYAEIVGRSESTVVQVNGVTASREGDFYHRQVSASNATAATQLDVGVLEIPGDLTERQLFFAGDPEEFEYDEDGNMTADGVWTYEWDGENRLKAMQMRPGIAEVRLAGTDPWIRLEFEYDWGGRRIVKRYLTATEEQVTNEGGGVFTILWDRPLRQNFVYDGWLLSASYRTKDDGEYLSVDQSYAWGPDLSDSYGGAGGIGGLAIYTDDLADSDGGTYIGPMFPTYDGNGNVVALYRLAPSSLTVQAAARYEYGPFGEALGLTGEQAHRFGVRWSTKFTDAETGLVYYGYRYYHPSLGRWISRDPIEEAGGFSLYNATMNRPLSLVDKHGLRPIPVDFNAFINGSRRGRWLSEPGSFPLLPIVPRPDVQGREFSTDWRDFGQSNHNLASPNARLMSIAFVESTLIGALDAVVGTSSVGVTHRRTSRLPNGPIIPELEGSESATAEVKNPNPTVRVLDPCSIDVSFNPSASYPFISFSPSIDYNVTFVFRIRAAGWVSVGIRGFHNRFPDYEAYVDGNLGYEYLSPDQGPSVVGFNVSTSIGSGIRWIVSVQADTPCHCPGGRQP